MEPWKSLNLKTEAVDLDLPGAGVSPVAVRQGETTTLRVYRTFHRDGHQFLGFSSYNLAPGEWEQEGVRRAEAYYQALKGNDPWYPLPVLQGTEFPVRTSTLEKQTLDRWVEPFAEVVRTASRSQPFRLEKGHLRLEKTRVLYQDSFGRVLEETRFLGALQMVIIPSGASETSACPIELRFSEFAPEVVQGFIEDQGQMACDAPKAHHWTPDGEFQILFQGPALAIILGYTVAQLGGPALAKGESPLRTGAALWDREAFGDTLSVTVLGPLYNSPDQRGFDDDGVVLKPLTLVENGLVKGFWATQAASHWLGLPLTGHPGNFSVSPGTLDRRTLSGLRIVEIQQLGNFRVDPATGEFSGEVRLAILHEGGTRKPVRGFSLAGNLRDVLTNARFSCDVGVWEHYEGPDFLVVPSEFIRSH